LEFEGESDDYGANPRKQRKVEDAKGERIEKIKA
jgi:hypothetical protein